jgi:hypothetical protein
MFLLRVFTRSKVVRRTEFRTALFGVQTIALLPSLSSTWPPTLSIVLNGISLANLNIDVFAPGKHLLF